MNKKTTRLTECDVKSDDDDDDEMMSKDHDIEKKEEKRQSKKRNRDCRQKGERERKNGREKKRVFLMSIREEKSRTDRMTKKAQREKGKHKAK